jgi:hypothetical protein
MTVSIDWKLKYKLFGDFLAGHPEIIITTSEVSIPQPFRDEFYQRFDDIRRAVVENHYSSLPDEIGLLSENYVRIEEEVKGLLGLTGIYMPTDLFSFLHSPKEGLIRAIYNRTFDLLQGKTTAEIYEQQSAEDLRAAALDYFRLGYEFWAALVLIRLLEPDEAFLVDLDDDYKPILGELKDISFGRQAHHPTMRIPEFVLHSRKMDKYVAVKMALAKEVETFAVRIKPPVRPKKKTGDTSFALDSRVMILSFMDAPEKIPIIADIYERAITSPDLMIEYITEAELGDPDALEQVRLHLDAMNPKLGTCLILVDSAREPAPEQIPTGIRAVSAGFDRSKLQTIIDALPKEA